MNILSADSLIVHRDDVSGVTANISLLVLILEVVLVLSSSSIILIITSTASDLAVGVVSMDTWQLLWRLLIVTLSSRAAVHTQLLVDVVQVLWSSELLQYIRHILAICACVWHLLLIIDVGMGPLNIDISQIVGVDQVQTKLTRFYEFHITNT